MTALTDATFYAPLKTTLVPTNGSGNPTFTRATTKTVEDNEGDVKTLKSGAVALAGARVIQNLFAAPATLATQGVTVTARTYTVSFYGTGTITFSGAYAGAALVGTGVSDRVQRTFTCTAGTLTCTVTGSCTNGQCEDVTGQAIQTAGEYVSVGVLADPYHGLGTDGAKCFGTDSSGVAIPDATMLGAQLDYASKTNSMLYCRDLTKGGDLNTTSPTSYARWRAEQIGSEPELVSNGTFDTTTTGWVALNTTLSSVAGVLRSTPTGAHQRASQGITTVIGVTYVINLTLMSVNGSSEVPVLLMGTSPGSGSMGCLSLTTAGTPQSMLFVATATTTYISLYSAEGVKYVEYDDVSVRKAAVQAALTQTGVDGLANSCSLVTFNAADATILQTITAASTPACTGFKVKRSVGTDPVYITRDGSTYTDISGLINSSTFTLVGIENTSVTNPVVGFKSSTGNAIIVDSGRNHSGTELCEDIFTTTAPVTRNAEVLTYQTSGNFSDTAGTILATIKRDNWTNGNGSAVGKASFGLLTSSANSGVQAADGTNTVSGAAGTPTGQRKIGARWSGSSLQAFYQTTNGTAGSYDGAFNLTTIAVMPGTQGYIRDLAIFNSSLSDGDIASAWELYTAYTLTCDAGSYSYTGIDATFNLARNLACETGSYAYTGLDMTLNLARNLACDPGAYAYTGIPAALTITTPARLITVNYNTPGITVNYNTYNIEVDA